MAPKPRVLDCCYNRPMAVRITYFVHGTTTDNERAIASGWSDVGLSKAGFQQCRELAGLTEDLTFDVVFTSDLKRAVDSATSAWGGKYPIVQDKRLREWNYGDFNASPAQVVEPLLKKSITTPMPNGESWAMVQARVQRFLDDLLREYDGQHVAIVAHRAPQLALDVLLRGKTWPEALAGDWRKTNSWRPGWAYTLRKAPP